MSSPEPIALALARHLNALRLENFSSGAVAMASIAITDTVGCALAGATEPCAALLLGTAIEEKPVGKARLWGSAVSGSVLDAALFNGTAAHAIDFDDMAEAMGGHPSVPVLPVAIALGEQLGASGAEVLEAYVVGFEAECRLGRAVHPHHYERGWHPTSTLGAFGACAAAARLLKLTDEQTAIAFGLCASMASGIKANFGTMTKPLHVGMAARNGLSAALMASRGYTANPGALEHKQGFFAAFDGLDHVRPERILQNQGGLLEIEQPMFGLKQFACCGSTHNAIMAMLEIRQQREIRVEDVASIAITAHRRRLPHTHNPFPTTPLQAKFSIQYATARALIDGPPRIEHFEGSAFQDPDAVILLHKITTQAYPFVTEELANEMAAEVTVTLVDGTSITGKSHLLGRGPANPMSASELWSKFSDCAQGVMPEGQAREAFQALQEISNAPRIGDVTRHLVRRNS